MSRSYQGKTAHQWLVELIDNPDRVKCGEYGQLLLLGENGEIERKIWGLSNRDRERLLAATREWNAGKLTSAMRNLVESFLTPFSRSLARNDAIDGADAVDALAEFYGDWMTLKRQERKGLLS